MSDDWGDDDNKKSDEDIEEFANNEDKLKDFLLNEVSYDNLKLVLGKISELKFTPSTDIIESTIQNAACNNEIIEMLIDKQCPVSFAAISDTLRVKCNLMYPLVSNACTEVRETVANRIPDIVLQVIQKDFSDADDVLRILLEDFKINVNYISNDENSGYERTALQETIQFGYMKSFNALINYAPDLNINLITPYEKSPPLVLAFHNGRYKMACKLVIDHFADINLIKWDEMPNETGFTQLYALLHTLGYKFDFDKIRKKYTLEDEYDYADEDMESIGEDNIQRIVKFNTEVTKEWHLFEKWIEDDRKQLKPLKIKAAEGVRRLTFSKVEMNDLIESYLWDDETKEALFLWHIKAYNEYSEKRINIGNVDFDPDYGSEFGDDDFYDDDYEGYEFDSDDNFNEYDEYDEYGHDMYENFG